MRRTYKFSIKTVAEYCPYDSLSYSNEKSDIIEHTIYFKGYHPQYQNYIDLLYNEFSDFEDHIGNLFYIIETNYEPYHSALMKSLLESQIYEELNRLHYLQSVLETADDKNRDINLTILQHPPSTLKSDFACKDKVLNKLLLESVLKISKDYFVNAYDFYCPNITNQLQYETNIPADELIKIRNKFKTQPAKYKAIRKNIELEMINIVFNYLRDTAKIVPIGKAVTKPIGIIIYYLLSIFKIVTKEDLTEEPLMVSHIRNTKRNAEEKKIRILSAPKHYN